MAGVKWRYTTVMAFGIVNTLLSVAMIVCGILLIVWNTQKGSFGAGIWGGLWALITGILGFVGGMKRMRGAIIAFMVLSILIAAAVSIAVLIINATSQVVDVVVSYQNNGNGYDVNANLQPIRTRQALAAFAGIWFFVSIFSASFACCAVCRCCGARDDTAVLPMRNPNVNQQQFQPGQQQMPKNPNSHWAETAVLSD